MFAEIAGSLLGGLAGQAAGMLTGGDGGNPWMLSDIQNQILQTALDKSIKMAQQGNKNALDTLKMQYEQGRRDITNAEKKAIQQNYLGYDLGRAVGTPYRNAGLFSLDKYQQSLGIPVPEGGSVARNNEAYKVQRMRQFLFDLTGNPYAAPPTKPGKGPGYTLDMISNKQVRDYMLSKIQQTGGEERPNQYAYGSIQTRGGKEKLLNDPNVVFAARKELFDSLYGPQMQAHQQKANNYNQYQSALNYFNTPGLFS